jgi:hypothetical protein
LNIYIEVRLQGPKEGLAGLELLAAKIMNAQPNSITNKQRAELVHKAILNSIMKAGVDISLIKKVYTKLTEFLKNKQHFS